MTAAIDSTSCSVQFDNLQETDSCIDKWSKDLTYYMNNLLEIEFELCDEVFKNNGSNVSVDCFVRISTESGFMDFIRFGNTVAERKKDAVKLFKLYIETIPYLE